MPVGVLVAPAPHQFRHQHVGDVLKIPGRNREGDVQSIDVRLFEPSFDIIGDLLGRADQHRADAADADMLRHLAHGPDPIRIGAGDVVHRAAAGVVLDVANLLVKIVGREIDAGPTGHQSERALGADVAAIVGVFGRGFRFGAPENDGHHAEHQDFSRVAASFRGEGPNGRHARRDDLGRRAGHEHAFGVLGCELASARRGAGLIKHRRTLRRRFAQVNGVDPIVVSLVLDPMHLRRVGENAARAITQRRVILPASFP